MTHPNQAGLKLLALLVSIKHTDPQLYNNPSVLDQFNRQVNEYHEKLKELLAEGNS